MSTPVHRYMLADLLDKVTHQEISASDALREMDRWREYPWKEKELSDAFHLLCHFDADADIRQKDPEFAALTTSQLLERSKKLRM